MNQSTQQTYRRIIQQHSVQQEVSLQKTHQDASLYKKAHTQSVVWEIGGIVALFSAAIACGVLAQFHLG